MLEFDAWQRCETAAQLVRWSLGGGEGARVLDVGGYPGRMRTFAPQFDWTLCDPRVDAPGQQLRGAAQALPFADKAFDFAVCLDVMEHIAPEHRGPALDEMARVSKRGVLLTFPHNHPAVTRAEDAVRDAHQRLFGKPHPWLAEHADHELPDAGAALETLAAHGGHGKAFNLGAVERWMRLQLLDLLLEDAGAVDFAAGLDEYYRDELFAHEFKEPAYRKVVLHLFEIDEPLDLAMVDTPRDDESAAQAELERRISAWWADEALQRRRREAERAQDQPAADLQDDYLERIEKGVEAWEAAYKDALAQLEESYAWRDALESRRSFRLYRFVMKMLGMRVEG